VRSLFQFMICALLNLGTLYAQELTIKLISGGPVVTSNVAYGVQVNKGSSLQRSFAIINDAAAPVELREVGILTQYADQHFSFVPAGIAIARDTLAAIEIRFILYNMFGERMRALSLSLIRDIGAGTPVVLRSIGSWDARESDVSGLLTIAAFVSNARTSDGHLWHADERKISDELEKLNLHMYSGVPEPSAPEKHTK